MKTAKKAKRPDIRFEVKAGSKVFYVYAPNRQIARTRFLAHFPVCKSHTIKLDRAPWTTSIEEGGKSKPGGHTYKGPKGEKDTRAKPVAK